jgi:hypothetical protein
MPTLTLIMDLTDTEAPLLQQVVAGVINYLLNPWSIDFKGFRIGSRILQNVQKHVLNIKDKSFRDGEDRIPKNI